MLKCTSTFNKVTTLINCIRKNATFPTISRQPFLISRELCTARVLTIKHFLMKLWKHLCLNLFPQGEWECLVDPMASCFMVNSEMTFHCTSKLIYSKMKLRLWLPRARPIFYMIIDNPNVSLEIVDYSLYTRCVALKDVYYKEKMDMLAYIFVEFNYLETLAKIFITPARQSQFIQENIFNNAPVCRSAIAMKTTSAFTGSYNQYPFW